jgi:hypothetical protein
LNYLLHCNIVAVTLTPPRNRGPGDPGCKGNQKLHTCIILYKGHGVACTVKAHVRSDHEISVSSTTIMYSTSISCYCAL